MPRGLCALTTLAACAPPTTSYFCALSAFGARIVPDTNLYRMEMGEDRFQTHRDDILEAPIWVHRGPYSTTRLKALKANHVWATGGARAQGRRLFGDVLGGLPQGKPRGLPGNPRQRQKTEVGRIRSCCQGWTGLDDCYKACWDVAPGGREGSGNT